LFYGKKQEASNYNFMSTFIYYSIYFVGS